MLQKRTRKGFYFCDKVHATMAIIESFEELIGNTPLLKLNKLFPPSQTTPSIYAKLELKNPYSIKDRPAMTMIKKAWEEGSINHETEVVEASSGNTAISIASLGATLGFPVKIFMHEGCSNERRQILTALGATVVLTPKKDLTEGARLLAIKYCEDSGGKAFFLNQHSNQSNALGHYTGLLSIYLKTFHHLIFNSLLL